MIYYIFFGGLNMQVIYINININFIYENKYLLYFYDLSLYNIVNKYMKLKNNLYKKNKKFGLFFFFL